MIHTATSYNAAPPTPADVVVLDREECLRLLGEKELGRVAVVQAGAPLIFPVNYVADGKAILFRTAAGTKLAAAPMTRVAFEVDGEDPREGDDPDDPGTVWSVMVTGDAHDVTDALDIFAQGLGRLSPRPAVTGERPYLIEIFIQEVSGRRFRRSPAR